VLRTQGGNKFLDPGLTPSSATYSYTFAGTPPTPPAGRSGPTASPSTRAPARAWPTAHRRVRVPARGVVRSRRRRHRRLRRRCPELLGTIDAELATFPVEFEYDRDFTCSATGSTDYPNVATIVETGQTADASVTVDCYDLDVDKDAETSFRWDWAIDKVEDAETTELFLYEGDVATLNYTVTARPPRPTTP
jgi:hypothetical protein